MRTKQIKMTLAAAVTVIAVTIACTGAIGNEKAPIDSEKAEVNIEFKKDKLIEVAFLSVDPNKKQQLNDEYFAKVMPIAKEYGLKPLGKVKIDYTYSEFVKPEMIGFFEWPSVEKHKAFLKDARFQKIKPIRDDALKSLRLGYFSVDESTNVTFESGTLIEIFAMWLDPANAPRMQTYFQNVMPLITGKGNKYDVKFPLRLKSMDYGNDTYKPQSFGVAIWKSKESNNQFFSSKEYAKIRHDKDAAISRLDVWHGEIITQ